MAIVNNFPVKEMRIQPYAIAYLDMLGTSDKIARDEAQRYLYILHAIYNVAVQFSGNEQLAGAGFGGIKVKIFSDNIILAAPLESEQDVPGIARLLKFAALFQSCATVMYNWTLRGGVTIGELFLDDTLVWGKGLLRAYELESRIAIYPRVVVDRPVLELLGTDNEFFCRDMDGQLFLHFLDAIAYGEDMEGRFRKHFADLLAEIRRPDGSYAERPLQKLQWYMHYVNSWYREHHPDASPLLTF